MNQEQFEKANNLFSHIKRCEGIIAHLQSEWNKRPLDRYSYTIASNSYPSPQIHAMIDPEIHTALMTKARDMYAEKLAKLKAELREL